MTEHEHKPRIRRTTRRAFLRGFGASLLAAPFVSGLAMRLLQAEEGVEPTRFVMVFTGNNQLPGHWVPPTGGETDFALAPALSALAPLRDRLLLAHGFHGRNGHSGGMSETTTGRPSTTGDGVATGGPSIDQYLANLWRDTAPLPSLECGVFAGNALNDQICYSPSGLPIPAVNSPMGTFNKVVSLASEDPAEATLRRQREASVLDVIAQDLTAAQRRLGAQTRVLLDEHLTLVRERERALQRPYQPFVCDAHDPPTSAGDHIAQIWSAHNDTIHTALRCGTTRVASLRVGGWGGTGGYGKLGLENGHHNVAHGGTADPDGDLLAINQWHARQLHSLLDSLASTPVLRGGTLLDHTVVIWFNELGLGEVNNHARGDIPVVIAGGAQAGFKNGRYYSFAGTHYQHFLFTVARTLGEPSLARFGDDGHQLLGDLLA